VLGSSEEVRLGIDTLGSGERRQWQ
jgi:hypothetical protein